MGDSARVTAGSGMASPRALLVLLFAVCSVILVFAGCDTRKTDSDAILKNAQRLKELEAKAHITLPPETVLLNATDGGGRDPSYGFYAWTVFSPQAIRLPPIEAKEYLDLPLEDTVKYVETSMRSGKILRPMCALFSDWESDLYTFTGTLVRAQKGDYLVIRQFKKK